MSLASSAVTYTFVYTDSELERVFWGSDEELSDGETIYLEYIPLEDEHILLAEEQPLPPVVSPTAESPEYVAESDLEEDLEEYEDDETEDGPVDYPMDGGDDGDDDDGDSFGDDANNEDDDEANEEEVEEEEHLAPADSAVVIPNDELVSPPEGTEPRQRERLARCTALAALPSPPLPPPLHMPPPVDRRDDIPKTEMPPHKRLCLSNLDSRYEVGESSTARPTGGRWIDYGFLSTLDAEARRRGIGEVKENNVQAYNERFQELTLICTKFVVDETEKIDKYVSGLPDNIYGSMKASKPKTLDETIELANDLMDQNFAPIKPLKGKMSPRSTIWGQARGSRTVGICPRTDGVVGLTRWIKMMESVFQISGCAVENQVKFATCTLLDASLTWWNSQKRYLGPDAYSMTWEVHKNKMTNKYCPQGEIKKLEIKLWNLKVKENNVQAYNERFQELTLICSNKSNDERESRLTIISCSKAQEYMAKGCQVFLAQISAKEDEDRSEGKQLEDVPFVRDYPKVFPKDLPSLPPTRPVEFQIELIPGAASVARAPYRLAPSEMKELSEQLQELSEKA
nr:putative reverse transcriptase domain-containing protein [Tanacetum cinerariifolium]